MRIYGISVISPSEVWVYLTGNGALFAINLGTSTFNIYKVPVIMISVTHAIVLSGT
jgi:hypothetical protein